MSEPHPATRPRTAPATLLPLAAPSRAGTVARSSLVRLLLLGAIWGMSFIFLRVAAPALGALPTTFGRVACGALLLAVFARLSGSSPGWRQHAAFHLTVGFFNTALPFFLFSWASMHTPSAYLATLNALAPLFAALFARLLTGERLTAQRLLGFACAVGGVALLVGLGPAPVTATLLMGVAAGLAAATCYGFAAVHVRRFGGRLAPLAVAAGSLEAAAMQLCLPVLALTLAPGSPALSPAFLQVPASFAQALPCLAVLLLGTFCTGLAYPLYFRVVADEGASRAVSVTFLVPVFATVWSVLLLGEALTFAAVAGMLLVLSGTALSLGLVPSGSLLPRLRRAGS